jgi:hypothetical protein
MFTTRSLYRHVSPNASTRLWNAYRNSTVKGSLARESNHQTATVSLRSRYCPCPSPSLLFWSLQLLDTLFFVISLYFLSELVSACHTPYPSNFHRPLTNCMMLPLIDILIILSGISAAQAGLIRRYANTTYQAAPMGTGVVYQPYAGSPSLSLAPMQGITTLPLSQPAETPAKVLAVSSAPSVPLSEASAAIATDEALFSYQPKGSDSTTNAGPTSPTCTKEISGAPTSFWTFGSQHDGTVTITSTTYTTISVPPQVVESASPQESAASQAQNATTTSMLGQTFSFDPLPKSTGSSTTETEASKTTADTGATDAPTRSNTQDFEATSTFAYPYPSSSAATASTTVTSQQSDATETAIETSSASKLPAVVTEGASETQSQQGMKTTDTTAVPGITIIPQNPSVIYITVTDAGATTTVTA